LPLVGIWVPMKFANSTGLDRYDRGASRGYFECVRVDDADFPAFVALGGRKLHGAKSKIDRRGTKLSTSDAAIFLKRAGNCGLKNEEFLPWHVCESLLADTKILRHDVRRCVRHPVGEKHGLVFREVAVIKDKQEFAAVGSESLDRMGNARGKKPKLVLFDVGDKALSICINASDPRGAIKHECPLCSGVPMQFADPTRSEPHVHAGKTLGDCKFALSDFAGPATFMKALVCKRKGVLEGLHSAGIGREAAGRGGSCSVDGRISGARIARTSIGLGLVIGLLLCGEFIYGENTCGGKSYRAHSQKSPSRQKVLLSFVVHGDHLSESKWIQSVDWKSDMVLSNAMQMRREYMHSKKMRRHALG